MKLLKVGEPLCWRLKAGFLTVYSFSEKLLCADLLRGFFDYQCMSVQEGLGGWAYPAPCS
jgi:hypothetical protein